jgi:hypothetical protein
VIFVAGKMVGTFSFVAVLNPGSEIRDGQKSGSGINIPDPQHWEETQKVKTRVLSGKKFINRNSTKSQVSIRVEIYAGVTPTAGGRARISCSNSS